ASCGAARSPGEALPRVECRRQIIARTIGEMGVEELDALPTNENEKHHRRGTGHRWPRTLGPRCLLPGAADSPERGEENSRNYRVRCVARPQACTLRVRHRWSPCAAVAHHCSFR